ncbi:PAZ domain-containing protein [Phellopilus nigrolimitatus]|nr:PAZ domain-containing protein [Phellopilus nigrolimitatus]
MPSVQKNLMVNINICMGAVYVQNARLSDAMIKYKQTSYGASNSQSIYRRVRVTMKHLGYRRKSGIKAFGRQSTRKTVFQCDELDGMVSVEQYFQRKFIIRLEHADDLPVVNVGNKAKDTFVPAELCEIESGQPYAGMLSERETLEMEKYTTVPPFVSAKTIAEQGLEVLGLPYRADQIFPRHGSRPSAPSQPAQSNLLIGLSPPPTDTGTPATCASTGPRTLLALPFSSLRTAGARTSGIPRTRRCAAW